MQLSMSQQVCTHIVSGLISLAYHHARKVSMGIGLATSEREGTAFESVVQVLSKP